MTTKEKIQAELNNLDEAQLKELYLVIKNFSQTQSITRKKMPRCAGIGESKMGNLSERDEELLWKND
jgi:hypothetical protein